MAREQIEQFDKRLDWTCLA